MRPNTLALDLEGTLISNSISMFPRPGLFAFLEGVRALFPRVVIMTAVPGRVFRQVAGVLEQEREVPPWFCDMEYVAWPRPYKDLACTGDKPEECLLVDDQESYVHPYQHSSWIPVREFEPPYGEDTELVRVFEEIAKRC